ncbi:WD40 repeat domain-containing protein [Streptomyces pratensis]|uniref:WD40 repeat domain-containing protein n=1 Tax=Streptomyces pratensis TaxID=1169025 RepID=UPI003630ABEB
MRWERPAAGREPAAAALLGWLADPQSPRLCLVSGSQGCGKSGLLAWLVHHGSRSGEPAERAVHAVVPSAGQSLSGTVWTLAEQLGIVARAPAELVAALRRDPRRTVIVMPDLHTEDVAELALDLVALTHVRLIVESRSQSPAHRLLTAGPCAELDLDLKQWRDQRRHEQWQAAMSDSHNTTRPKPVKATEDLDLSDPVAVCEADPWQVTAAYDSDGVHEHGGLRAAWHRVGQALCREQQPASRALHLLSALGDGADPRITPTLRDIAAGADWRMIWSRVRGDMTPPWPGPVAALAMGTGPLADSLVVAGSGGIVKAVCIADAGAHGRLPPMSFQPVAMTVLADGVVLMLDENGRIEAGSGWATQSAESGLVGLLDQGPTTTQRLLDTLRGHTGTALTHATGNDVGIVALGDVSGTVRVFGDVSDTATLHDGPVNSLTALNLPLGDGVSVPLLYSGGADGTVRAWSPGTDPMSGPVLQRPCPVVSLDSSATPDGPAIVVAWSDSTVEYIHWATGVRQTFRPGPPVRAVALDENGRVLIGTDESLTSLIPRHPSVDADVVQQREPAE